MDYVELHARSACSFLRGASHPEALAAAAADLGMKELAVCDRDGVYGAARVYNAAKDKGVRSIVGAELTLDDGSVLPVLVKSREGYRNLCQLITRAKLRGTKTDAPVQREEMAEFAEGLIALTGDEEGPVRQALARKDPAGAQAAVEQLKSVFGPENVYVEIQRHLRRGEERENDALRDLARAASLPLLATNGALYATPEERAVLDVFTCARHHTHLDAAGRLLAVNEERHLKPADRMARLFADLPEAIVSTRRLADRLEFTLENLGYEFPKFRVPAGETMDSHLRNLTLAGAKRFYPDGSPAAYAQIDKELDLIARLKFSGYFLIVWDLMEYCKKSNILAQGRGSAANSVVCYSLGITACDPIACKLLFERFLTEGRSSWPDIDIDLPSGDRRERVIQEVYQRYGKHGAAMTANVITFRGRSAMREIGKALNFPPDVLTRFSHLFGQGDFPHTLELQAQVEQSGIANTHPRAASAVALYQRIYGLPRHLGQHSGGMIICEGQLSGIVPLENASMPGRVVAQWDKDDCEDLGIIKVDLLGLGMMAAMQDTFELCEAREGRKITLASIPKDDPATFELLCKADTVGTFQVESRAQIATLPRLQPKVFYDVVVEVALIRPGPIQGNMVHPYLKRRKGEEAIEYIHDDLKPTLERTLGVPLFQEQLLKIAMVMADFTGSEAEELRRALSFHRSKERMDKVCVKLRDGLAKKRVDPAVAERIVQSVQSFAVYGFPESHALSFGLIAYCSCWMKVHYAPEFYGGLLNNQPMGFYSAATLVKDAKRRGVRIRPANVQESDWLCTIGDDRSLRLGLCYVRDLKAADGLRVVEERKRAPFASLVNFQLRTALPKAAVRSLAKVGALNGLSEHRRTAQWQVEIARDQDDLFSRAESLRPAPLQPMSPFERLNADYAGTSLTIGPHPMALVRGRLPHLWRATDLESGANGSRISIGGMVICRQRPGTAKGVVFISLEDETGISNAIVSAALFERMRLRISEESFLEIRGELQKVENVIHVKAREIVPLLMETMSTPTSHDFH